MKKFMDKLRLKIYFNKNLFVFLLVIVLVGVGSGSFFSVIISDSDKKMVADYLNNFINNTFNNKLDFNFSFIDNIIFSFGFSVLIWVFGISIIGIFLVIPFLFIKSFVLGFSIGSILINFKFKGIIIALIYIVPHHVINILIYILLSSYAIMVSHRLFSCMNGKKVFDFKVFIGKYTFVLLFSLIILFFTSFYESFLLPSIIKAVINLIK